MQALATMPSDTPAAYASIGIDAFRSTLTRADDVAAIASGKPSLTVQTAYINEHGSGWFFFLASGPTGTFAADHRQHCIRRLDVETGLYASRWRRMHNISLREPVISAAGLWQVWAGKCEANSPGYSDGLRTSARFSQPQGICSHPRGHLLVADKGNHCIRQITEEGALHLLLTTHCAIMAGAWALPILLPSNQCVPRTNAQH